VLSIKRDREKKKRLSRPKLYSNIFMALKMLVKSRKLSIMK